MAILDSLEDLLDRRTSIAPIQALHQGIVRSPPRTSLENTAVGFDASVFLRLSKHSKRDDIVDYLDTRLSGPLILPGQAIQEFWNNQLAVVSTIASGLKKKFDVLKQDAEKLDSNFAKYAEKMDALLNEFSEEYGFAYDPATFRSTATILGVFERKALVPYVPRVRFQLIAETRKRTKTPPGFLDPGDGDFYIWADFLLGLLQAREDGRLFEHAIIVTNDTKPDWSRDGVAHPILAAEVRQLLGASFELWTIDQLARAVTPERQGHLAGSDTANANVAPLIVPDTPATASGQPA